MSFAVEADVQSNCPDDIWASASAAQKAQAIANANDFAKGYLRAAGLITVATEDASHVEGLVPAICRLAVFELGGMTNLIHSENSVLEKHAVSAEKWLVSVGARRILPVADANLDSDDTDTYNDAPSMLTAAF